MLEVMQQRSLQSIIYRHRERPVYSIRNGGGVVSVLAALGRVIGWNNSSGKF